MTVDTHVSIIRPCDDEMAYFVGFWGITHEREIEALHTGSTGQTELPRDRLMAMPIVRPGEIALKKFNAVVDPMVRQICRNQAENRQLAVLRDSLLPRLMSGEIDVSAVTLPE